MIQSAVTVSLVAEARGGPFVFWDDLAGACRDAQQLGFDAIEVFPPGPEAVDVKQLRQLLQDHGLKLAAVGTGAGWVKHRLTLGLPDAGARQKARDFVRSIIDLAGPFGAPAIIGSMQGRWGDGVDRIRARQPLCFLVYESRRWPNHLHAGIRPGERKRDTDHPAQLVWLSLHR